MRSVTLASLTALALLAHRTLAFDVYLNEESDCPEDSIDIVCEDQSVGDCCNGNVGETYSSAQATDGQGGIVLYALNQGMPQDAPNRCGIQVARDDECATEPVGSGAAAGALGDEGDNEENPSTDEEPTDGDEDGEDDGGGEHDRKVKRNRKTRSPAPKSANPFIEENKKVKRGASGWRQQQHTAYAVRTPTHVYKLARNSEHVAAYLRLTDRQERKDFVKTFGEAKLR